MTGGLMSKALRAGVVAAALAAVLASTGCSGSSPNYGYYGPNPGTSAPRWHLGVVVADNAEGGALVTGVLANEPAASVGLEPGDVIVQANGLTVRGVEDLQNVILWSNGSLQLVVWKPRFGAAHTYDVQLRFW
jgi:S1-C subfamily serine protease